MLRLLVATEGIEVIELLCDTAFLLVNHSLFGYLNGV